MVCVATNYDHRGDFVVRSSLAWPDASDWRSGGHHFHGLDIMLKSKLKENYVYRFDNGELAVFGYISQTGMPVFHPLGEPSFQDVFGVNDLSTVVEEVRPATQQEIGGEE